MNKKVQLELELAARDCRTLEGFRIQLFFRMGDHVSAIARINNSFRPAKDGEKTITEAVEIVRNYIEATAHDDGFKAPPRSNLYWFTALRASRSLPSHERNTLIKHGVSWTQMFYYINLDKSERNKLLDGLKKGQRFDLRKTNKWNKRKISTQIIDADAEPEGGIPIQVYRPIDNDKVENLLSAICGDIKARRTEMTFQELTSTFKNVYQRFTHEEGGLYEASTGR